MLHSIFVHRLVGVIFTLLIFGMPLLLILIYPLTAFAGGWSTFVRRRYNQPEWNHSETPDRHDG